MNHKKVYSDLVAKCKLRGNYKKDLDYFTEAHHIIPKSLGGSDGLHNKVLLTPREHYIAHLLLIKMYPDSLEMIRAVRFMGDRGKIKNSRLFANIRQAYTEMSSGKGNPFYGKTHSESNRKIMGDARRGKRMPPESIERTRLANLGSKRSEQAIQNMSIAAKNKKPWQISAVVINPRSLSLWAMSDSLYDLWIESGRLGIRRYTKVYNFIYSDEFESSILSTIRQKFVDGWIPQQDPEWVNFKEDYYGRR